MCWHDGAKQAFTLARQAGVMTVLDGDMLRQLVILASWWR